MFTISTNNHEGVYTLSTSHEGQKWFPGGPVRSGGPVQRSDRIMWGIRGTMNPLEKQFGQAGYRRLWYSSGNFAHWELWPLFFLCGICTLIWCLT
jgi:hypothetical protein